MLRFVIALLAFGVVTVRAEDPLQKFNLPKVYDVNKDPKRFVLTDLVWPAEHGQADVCLWKDDKMAALSFTVDDNYKGEHEYWFRRMDHYEWKMTWFMIVHYVYYGINSGFTGTWADWRDLKSRGHDVGSHTFSHGHCADYTSPFYCYPETSLYNDGDTVWNSCCDPDTEFSWAQRIISDSLDDSPCLVQAFAGFSRFKTVTVDGKTLYQYTYDQEYEDAQKYYIAVRSSYSVNPANGLSYMRVGVNGCASDTTGGRYTIPLIDYATSRKAATSFNSMYYRAWINKYWHSMGDTSETNQWFDYVKSKEDSLWVGKFAEIAKYGQERDTKMLSVTSVTDDLIRFTVGDSMADTIYDFPLTVKVRVNNDWDTVSATQNGDAVDVAVVEHTGNKYALVQAVPDRGEVVLSNGLTTYIQPVQARINPAGTSGSRLYDCSGRQVRSGELKSGMYLRYDDVTGSLLRVMVIE